MNNTSDSEHEHVYAYQELGMCRRSTVPVGVHCSDTNELNTPSIFIRVV
mgnify:FL=1